MTQGETYLGAGFNMDFEQYGRVLQARAEMGIPTRRHHFEFNRAGNLKFTPERIAELEEQDRQTSLTTAFQLLRMK